VPRRRRWFVRIARWLVRSTGCSRRLATTLEATIVAWVNERTERRLLIPGFRRLLHGGDYNPDQWLSRPEVLDEDFRLMKLAGCNTFTLGIFAWTSYEPEEGKYCFDWLDRMMDRMSEAGHRVILATPSGAKPAWLSKKYPEVRRVTRDGLREPHRDRHNHCWTSPVYREKVRAIDTALARRYRGHPALGMWHVSNEYSGECYCETCLAKWQRWLEARYGSIDELNRAWWTSFWSHTFTAFDEIDPREWATDGLVLDWKRFNSDQAIDFYEWELEPLRRETPEVPCTTNFMGLFSGIDYAKLAERVDLVADDQYPRYDVRSAASVRTAVGVSFKDDLFRCFKPDRPWMLMESCPDAVQWNVPMRLKPAHAHRTEMLQAVAHGAEGTCYFQWRKGRGGMEKHHGAVVDHVGHEHTRVFRSVAAVGASYEKLSEIIGSVVEAEVGLIYDWEVRWAFESSYGVLNRGEAYPRVAIDHYQAFWEMGVPVDVIGSTRSFDGYKVLIAPQLHLLKPGVASRLARFVEQGGVLVGTYYTGFVNESQLCFDDGFPGDGLTRVFGLWNEETDSLEPELTQALVTVPGSPLELAERYAAGDVCALVQVRGAEVLGTYAEGFYAGSPALTRYAFGDGVAYYQAARMPVAFQRDFYREIVRVHGVEPVLPVELPPGMTLQRRRKGKREYYFAHHFGQERASLSLAGLGLSELWSGEPVEVLELGSFESAVLYR
jgi:beta-galactosidase